MIKRIARALVDRLPYVGRAFRQRDELRAVVNRLWVEPGHYYSPITSIDEVRGAHRSLFAEPPSAVAAVELREAEQLALLGELMPYMAEHPFSTQPQSVTRYGFENQQFNRTDALCLYGMLRHLRPKRYVEVGSGYSSSVVLDTMERHPDVEIACTLIEPYPQRLRSLLRPGDEGRFTLLECRLQDVDDAVFEQLDAGDVLFIDSTHVAKTGSDVNDVFFRILPRLRSGVIVHLHDVHYPFEYPEEWVYQGRSWNETYMLHAFLQYNRAFEILLFASYLQRRHGERLVPLLPPEPADRAGSFWMRKA